MSGARACPRPFLWPCGGVWARPDPPFEGIVGAFVAMSKGKPYLYNIRDMYPDMAVGGSIVEPGMMARVLGRMHRWALRRGGRLGVLGVGIGKCIPSQRHAAQKTGSAPGGTAI